MFPNPQDKTDQSDLFKQQSIIKQSSPWKGKYIPTQQQDSKAFLTQDKRNGNMCESEIKAKTGIYVTEL